MKEPGIERVAIIGAGLMGYGIGVEYARFGYQVSLYNTKKQTSEKAMEQSHEALSLMAENGLITKREADAAYKRLHPSIDLEEAVKNADFVCESVLEILHIKKEIFARLDKLCPPSTILATNTSGLLVTDIASVTEHPERVVLTHYFQPPHLVPLVEVVGGQKTAPGVVEKTARLLSGMHKKAVVLNKETRSFAGNKIQGAIAKAIQELVDQGVCTPEVIDDVISFGFGRRMAYTGYFKRMDLIGLDFLYTAAKEHGSEPWKLLAGHVERGEFGMKTGKGFYDWPGDSAKQLHHWQNTELIRMMKLDIEEGRI